MAVMPLSSPAWASTSLESVAPRYVWVGMLSDFATWAYEQSSMAVSTAPIGVAPLRMSKMAAAPPQTIGAPAPASWWIVIPARHSAVCCVMVPSMVTGAAAPDSGTDTISAGIPARASAIRFPAPKLDQIKGGAGHTSKIARGFSRAAWRLPANTASISIISCTVLFENAPVTIGFFEYSSARNSLYESWISLGTSWQITAVDCASYWGSCSATLSRRIR